MCISSFPHNLTNLNVHNELILGGGVFLLQSQLGLSQHELLAAVVLVAADGGAGGGRRGRGGGRDRGGLVVVVVLFAAAFHLHLLGLGLALGPQSDDLTLGLVLLFLLLHAVAVFGPGGGSLEMMLMRSPLLLLPLLLHPPILEPDLDLPLRQVQARGDLVALRAAHVPAEDGGQEQTIYRHSLQLVL